MNKNQLINGFTYGLEDGFIGIDNGNFNSPLPINEYTVNKVLETMKKHNIKNLFFGDPFMDLKDINFLERFTFLEGLRIALRDFDIEPIRYCPNIIELIIAFNYEGDFDFSFFEHLKSLSLVWKNKSSESIFKCNSLESLSLSKYSGLSLQEFSVYENTLEELYITDSSIKTLSGIESLKNLKRLHIIGARKLTDIEDVQNCDNLEQVFIHGCNKIENLHYLMYLKKIRIINLDSLGSIPTIKFLKPLKSLEEFYMGESTNVIDGDLNILEELKNKFKLNKVIFTNRKHYTHTREKLGFKIPSSIDLIFNKKKRRK